MGNFAECCTRQKTPLPSAMVTALGKAGKMGARKTVFPASPSAKTMTLGKDLKNNSNFAECQTNGTRQRIFFKKNSNFAECQPEGTRQRILKKNQTLPSAGQGALGKEFFFKKNKKSLPGACRVDTRQRIFLKKNKKIFAECLQVGTRQSHR